MDWLELARGPAMRISVAVFLAGVALRAVSLLRRRRDPVRSAARAGSPSATAAAFGAALHRMWPSAPFREQAAVPTVVAYVFHLGLLVIVVLGTPHILFLSGVLGVRWPGLPKGIIDAVSGITLGALGFALWQRLHHPVRRHLSNVDDYLSWALTTLPVLTGLAATTPIGGRYETLLALHLFSVELLLIWFPFGKLMHAFLFGFSRGVTGIRYGRRGVKV